MKILIYGDSNSFGSKPNLDTYKKNGKEKVYNAEKLWWYAFAENNDLTINALPGRCVCHENKWLPKRNASKEISTDVCGFYELAIFMLGTNDLKSEFSETSCREIAFEMTQIIKKVKLMCGNPTIILISPPRVKEGTEVTDKYYQGAEEKSVELDWYYKNIAIYNGYHYVSGLEAEVGIDGEHLTTKGHKYIQEAVLKKCKEITSVYENC